MSDVTRILSQIEQGDPQAAEKLLPLAYDELRKLAAVKLAREKPGQTLQATALLDEPFERVEEPRDKALAICEGLGQKHKVQHIDTGLSGRPCADVVLPPAFRPK